MQKLDAKEIKTALAQIPVWKRSRATIKRTFEFEDFVEAMKFVARVARLAERKQHHPDIDIRWNRVTLSLTTHDTGGLTRKDFELAALIEQP